MPLSLSSVAAAQEVWHSGGSVSRVGVRSEMGSGELPVARRQRDSGSRSPLKRPVWGPTGVPSTSWWRTTIGILLMINGDGLRLWTVRYSNEWGSRYLFQKAGALYLGRSRGKASGLWRLARLGSTGSYGKSELAKLH